MKKSLDIEGIMQRASDAAERFLRYDQGWTDRIVSAAYKAGFNSRISLAKHAHEETFLGKWEDKVIKNFIATHLVHEDIRDLKTVGIISEDEENGIIEIAKPLGPLFAVTPVTNPTSTVMFKILIALKTRNPIIISPHGGARNSSIAAAKLLYEAALAEGAPENCVQWIKRTTKKEIQELMSHKKVAMILATGSVGLVKASYMSGNPTIGVGPGNVPVFLGKSTDVEFSVEQIFRSKTFDNGTVCASEQALVLQKYNADQVIEEFKKRKAYFLKKDEIPKLEEVAFNKTMKVMNASVIGQSATTIAKMANIDVPPDTTLLIAQLDKVGIDSPLSLEILAPILALYIVEDIIAGIDQCAEINKYGGLGHTVSIFSENIERIKYFASVLNAGRIIVNTPSSQGALGGVYNRLQPSMTLACGSGGKNITTDNISARHLLNIQRIAWRKEMPCLDHIDNGALLDESIDADKYEKQCIKK